MLGNYLDLCVIFYVLIYAWSASKKSVPDLLSNLLSLLLALPLTFASYSLSAGFFESNFQIDGSYANVLGFFLNLFLLKLVFTLVWDKLFRKEARFFKGKQVWRERLHAGVLAALYAASTIFILFSSVSALSLPAFLDSQIGESRVGSFLQSDPLRLHDDFQGVFDSVLRSALKDFSFLKVQTGPTERRDLPAKVLETTVDSAAEEKMLVMVNAERTARGIKPLVMDEEARRAARDYGKYLFQNGIFDHTDLEGRSPSDRIKTYDIEFMMAGENLAFAPSLEEAHTGLMNSQGHRENILRPFFGRVGIGVIDGGEDYGMIFVQEFLD